MNRIPRITLTQASSLLTNQKITSTSLSIHCHKVATYGENTLKLNAFTNLLPIEDVISQSKASDQRHKEGRALSPLDGIPVSIKANIAVRDLPLTAGSKILGASTKKDSNKHNNNNNNSNMKCGYDSDVAKRLLRNAGAVLIGLTNMDEFGMGSLGTNTDVHGPTRNPLPYLHSLTNQHKNEGCPTSMVMNIESEQDLKRFSAFHTKPLHENDDDYDKLPILSAGGSSCGSAASVSHGSSLLSIGTDTGGSVRLPAAWCGVTGFKPTYGLISRFGVVSYASSLDTVGILVPTPNCAALALDLLVNRDGDDDSAIRDSTSVFVTNHDNTPIPAIEEEEEEEDDTPLKGMRIGIPAAFSILETSEIVQSAWRRAASILSERGATLHVIEPENRIRTQTIQKSLSAYYVLACAEASSNLSRYDGVRYGMDRDAVLLQNPSEEESDRNGDDDQTTPLEKQYSRYRSLGFGNEVMTRILSGTAVLSSDLYHTHYEAAAMLRVFIKREFDSAFGMNNNINEEEEEEGVHVMLVPTALTLPPLLNEDVDGTQMLANDAMTVPISLAGLPAVSVPMDMRDVVAEESKEHQDGGDYCCPVVGLQLFAPRFQEQLVLKAASALASSSSTM